MIDIAILDAARNCERDGATAVLTLRSGVKITGKLERIPTPSDNVAHIKTSMGGWATVRIEEIAAVESRR